MNELTPQERALNAKLKQLQFNAAPAKLDELVLRPQPAQAQPRQNMVVITLAMLAAAALFAVLFFTFRPDETAPAYPRPAFAADDDEQKCMLSEAQAAQLAADYLDLIQRELELIKKLEAEREKEINAAIARGASVDISNDSFYSETRKWRMQQPFVRTLNGVIASPDTRARTRAAAALFKRYPDLVKLMDDGKYEFQREWDRVIWYVWDMCKLDPATAEPLALALLKNPAPKKHSDLMQDEIIKIIESVTGDILAADNYFYRQLFDQYLALAGHKESLNAVSELAKKFVSDYNHYSDNGLDAAYIIGRRDPRAAREAMRKMLKPELTAVALCDEYALALAKACDTLLRDKDYDSVRATIERFKGSFDYYDAKLARNPDAHLYCLDAPGGMMHFSSWQEFLEPGEEAWKEDIVTSPDFAGRFFLFIGIAALELVKDKKMPDDPHRLPHMLDLPAIRKDAYDSHTLSRAQCLKRLEALEQWAATLK